MKAYLPSWMETALFALALCMVMVTVEAHAGDAAAPRPVMLVASPELQGAYGKAVVLAVPKNGLHVGFILNRSTRVALHTLFPNHLPAAKVAAPVYFGGPEMAQALFAVVGRDPGGEAWPLFGGFYVATTAETIDRIIEETPNEARYFAGFVGWEPGELEKEIAAGYWYVTDPDPELLRRDAHSAWEELVKRLGNGHAAPRGLISASL